MEIAGLLFLAFQKRFQHILYSKTVMYTSEYKQKGCERKMRGVHSSTYYRAVARLKWDPRQTTRELLRVSGGIPPTKILNLDSWKCPFQRFERYLDTFFGTVWHNFISFFLMIKITVAFYHWIASTFAALFWWFFLFQYVSDFLFMYLTNRNWS